MKFWQKIYIFSLMLVILAISITGLVIVRNLHSSLLNKEIEKSITEEKLLVRELNMDKFYADKFINRYKGIYGDNETAYIKDLPMESSLDEKIRNFMSATPCEGKFKILDINNKTLFTDWDFPIIEDMDELNDLSTDTSKFILKKHNGRQYIYIGCLSKHQGQHIKVYYAKDVTSIYVQIKNNYIFFIKLSLWICFIFSIFMLFISKIITRPIENLIESTNKIADGNYSERVKKCTNDEFGILSDQFNKMAQTVEDKIRELEDSNQAKETFINNFTHELKTPLTSIIGYADLIRTSKYDEALFFESADYIYKEGKQLEKMAFKMMDLIYAKSHDLTLKNINIKELFDELEKTFSVKLEKAQINLNIQDMPAEFKGDPILIKMLLSNLIDNAIKASPKESTIYLSSAIMDGHIVLSVRDEGIGIPKEHLEKVCQPFYIVDPSRTKKNNGAGIGLAICQKIAQVHNAAFKIESESGKGTKVSVIFD